MLYSWYRGQCIRYMAIGNIREGKRIFSFSLQAQIHFESCIAFREELMMEYAKLIENRKHGD